MDELMLKCSNHLERKKQYNTFALQRWNIAVFIHVPNNPLFRMHPSLTQVLNEILTYYEKIFTYEYRRVSIYASK